eukprot:960805-Alexandrium_andersonii.AAC.1
MLCRIRAMCFENVWTAAWQACSVAALYITLGLGMELDSRFPWEASLPFSRVTPRQSGLVSSQRIPIPQSPEARTRDRASHSSLQQAVIAWARFQGRGSKSWLSSVPLACAVENTG